MASFDQLLQQIHTGAIAAPLVAETNESITINPDRTYTLPEGYNVIVAYEGDVNSQIITFVCPIISEGHNLFECQEKRLRWKNKQSGNEGSSKLRSEKIDDNHMSLGWVVPAEAFTKAGELSISISIFDLYQGKIAYSWNTPSLELLQVGATLDDVSHKIEHEGIEYIPPKNEILVINTESRSIIAPQGYNPVFCNYGDIGTSVVYFQVKRYIRGIDLLDDGTTYNMYWKLDGLSNIDSSTKESELSKNLYAVELDSRDSEGLVNVIWKPSKALTENTLNYFGKVTIQLEIVSVDGRVWRTTPYRQLEIGQSEFSPYVTDLPGEESNINAYIIDGAITMEDKNVNTVSGLVKLRTFTEKQPIFVNKNELVIENDDDGNYVGVKIGVVNNQDARVAPYVAYTPSTIIIVDGGDAFGN